jgi:uncharacterized OB-fold protein
MEVLQPGEGGAPLVEGRPLPDPDDLSREFWHGAHEGHLLFQQCPSCGHRQFYPRLICTACAATPEWAEASGRGRVRTFSIVRQAVHPPFRQMAPYVVAMVELDEGPLMMSNITGIAVEEVSIGMPVEAYAVPFADDLALPFWRPIPA